MVDPRAGNWDYLVLSAANDAQADAYDQQLRLRRRLGLVAPVRDVLVVADPGGKRVGSGGSTICCLAEVLARESARTRRAPTDGPAWLELLSPLRILIVHGGGHSIRLPTYGPCGKIFLPLPGRSDSALPTTLFDRQLPTYLALPPACAEGQIVIASGDVLLSFDPSQVRFAHGGLTGLGCRASPQEAAGHGVYCAADGLVQRFLQKPTPEKQAEYRAIGPDGRSVLDIGVMSFDAAAAVALLEMCETAPNPEGKLAWSGPVGDAIQEAGLDFYREICCALGAKASATHHASAARAGGSGLSRAVLKRIFEALREVPFHVEVLEGCRFRHFGTTRRIIASGADLCRQDGHDLKATCLDINNQIGDRGDIIGADAWVEACRVNAALTLAGRNVVVGVDIDAPLALPNGACLDVTAGKSRGARVLHFIRCYGTDDNFKDALDQGATLCNVPVARWLKAAGLRADDLWDAHLPPAQRNIWNARVIPAEARPSGFTRWLWMFDPAEAGDADRQAFLAADRYSPGDIAALADQRAFHSRRLAIRSENIRRDPAAIFTGGSGYSASDLACSLASAENPAGLVNGLLTEAHRTFHADQARGAAGFTSARIMHTLGSALLGPSAGPRVLPAVMAGLADIPPGPQPDWLGELGLWPPGDANQWAEQLKAVAFELLERTIVRGVRRRGDHPTSAVGRGQTVWSRAAARLDLAGGWTDTPPYSLERGGCVLNAAVALKGEPPVRTSIRLIERPVVRIVSEDQDTGVEIAELDELLDYRRPASEFALAKAALALSGFSPESAAWPPDASLERMLELFGGGIELTTSAAVPKGSGLGTSSIVGATLLAAIHRAMGRQLAQKELFYGVLRLEQALTAGGGWQDQIGGAVSGVKLITTEAGLVPEPEIRPVRPDLLDPAVNGGITLLYYTGINRLAKDILQQVVGRYLDRDRRTVATLAALGELAPRAAEAMECRDLPTFGRLIDAVWELNKQLDPSSTNDEIEDLLERARPHVHGAKLLGAGGGGFLLLVCKSPEDAGAVREMLHAEPPNDRAAFFDFDISTQGLTVTVC